MYVLNKHHILIRKLKRQGFCCEIGGKHNRFSVRSI